MSRSGRAAPLRRLQPGPDELRVALTEMVRRLHDVKLKPGVDIKFHTANNRAPLSVPITFTPGSREA